MATRTAGDRRLEVHPFRRDGHYLVAAFDVVNGPEGVDTAYSIADPELDGAVFGGFHMRDPASGTVYGTVRVGKEDPDDTDWWADPGKWPFRYGEDSKDRGWIYFAAPPPSTKAVDLVAGPYGVVKNVPIR